MQLPYHNMQIKHWNPGAEKPLLLPINVICNTSDEEIFNNIRQNSRLPKKWINYSEPHGKTAILCGSGPSIADNLDDIRRLSAEGGVIFAMNGSARYLSDNGIIPDYQVILDARIETADLIGPAKKHLFASQSHPECFKRAPDADIWQLQVAGIDDVLPDYEEPYSLVGGAASVGNTTTCLAYVMGFRDYQIFGYDSSQKDGNSHAFRQQMNDGDPCAYVDFNGKTYIVSLTMKLQAEKFQETAANLIALGCTIKVNGTGLLPDMFNAEREEITEQEKYQRMWSIDGYRTISPGAECADKFLSLVTPDSTIVDFGCGTGKASLAFKARGFDVVLTDFAENSRDEEARSLPFVQCDLTKPIPLNHQYGFCADVMEHIPTADVALVVSNIMNAADTVFFQISTIPDNFGATINQVLHLTVKPHSWWKDLFYSMNYHILWSEEQDIAALFIIKRR